MESNILNLNKGPKYNPLKKLANAANKAKDSKELIGVLAEFEKATNKKFEEVINNASTISKKENHEKIPLFTNKNGGAVKTVLAKEKLKKTLKRDTEDAYIR